MKLKQYLLTFQYPDLVFDSINIMVCIDAGIPQLLVAPTNAGKSTIIQAMRGRFEKQGYAVENIIKISPIRLVNISEHIEGKNALMLSEDFSTIGKDEDATEKMCMIIAQLSYDKHYEDPLFKTLDAPEGLRCHVKKLAFVCGFQPLWLSIYVEKEVFETIIGEKLLRYYMLPILPRKQNVPMNILKDYLDTLKFNYDTNYEVQEYYVKMLCNAIEVQAGNRGMEYTVQIIASLKKYVPKEIINEWIKYISQRFSFESVLMTSYYATEVQKTRTVHTLHKEYHVLYFALAYNSLDNIRLAKLLKIRGRTKDLTKRYINLLIRMTMKEKLVTVLRTKNSLKVIPSDEFKKYSLHTWHTKDLNHIDDKQLIDVVEDDN